MQQTIIDQHIYLFVIEFEHCGAAEAFFNGLEAIEMLTKVDVADALGVVVHCCDELLDSGVADG